jgi:uncharacterized protein YbjT (DUF2867 family)
MKTIVIFGGSGFVGRAVTKKLVKNNIRVKVITRDQERSSYVRVMNGPDFLSLIQWDYKDLEVLEEILSNSDGIVNLVGILNSSASNSFHKIHVDLNRMLAEKAKKMKVKYFIYNSALKIEQNPDSKYAQSKLGAEKAIQKIFPKATILRPSIIVGKNDHFFNRFKNMANKILLLPLIGGGKSKFQPIYVEDVAEIIFKALSKDIYQGKVYEIGGDEIYSFEELMKIIAKNLHKKIYFIHIPFFIANILAFFLSIFTKNILTCDQIKLLKSDNILSDQSFKKDFDITLKSLKEIKF